MNEVYIVTAGDYSDYHIEAVFKDKAKAEAYCKCHKDCEIKDFGFSDDNIYTIFNYVRIQYNIYLNRDSDNNPYVQFGRLSKEDDGWYNKNDVNVSVYHDWLTIILNRKLPEVYDKDEIREKYTKVLYDLRAEIKCMLSEQDTSSFDKRGIAANNILKAIEGKFGIEKE